MTSPLEVLTEAPPGIWEHVAGERVEPMVASPAPKRHWMYRVGASLVLHVHEPASARLAHAVGERREIDALGLAGIPRLLVYEAAGGRAWVLEEHVPGSAPPIDRPGSWFPTVAHRLVGMAGPPGPALATTPFWEDHREPAIACTPAPARAQVADAWAAVGDLPSRVVHGDAQPKNIARRGTDVALVDWEGAWRHGIAGLDLLFLATMTSPSAPDPDVARQLLSGRDPVDRPLLGPLGALGLEGNLVRETVVAVLSVWTIGERRRIDRAAAAEQTPPQNHRTPFRAMLQELLQ